MSKDIKPGVYRATIHNAAVASKEKNGEPVPVPEIELSLTALWGRKSSDPEDAQKRWLNCSQLGWKTKAFVHIVSKKGEAIDFNIDQLKDSTGWDPATGIRGLQETLQKSPGKQVLVAIEENEWKDRNGQTRRGTNVARIAKGDADPEAVASGSKPVEAADSGTLSKMASKFDNMFAAFASSEAPADEGFDDEGDDDLPF